MIGGRGVRWLFAGLLLAGSMAPAWSARKADGKQLKLYTKPGSPDQIGYIIFESFWDPAGNCVGIRQFDTEPGFGQVAAKVAEKWEPRRPPVMRAGRPVSARMVEPLVFNLPNSSPFDPFSNPHLFVPSLVEDPQRAPDAPPAVVWAEVEVNVKGQAVGVRNAPAGQGELLLAAAKSWRFMPARDNSEPAAGVLKTPFILVSPSTGSPGEAYTGPEVLHQEPPEYSPRLREQGIGGVVVIGLWISPEGRPEAVQVQQSENKKFNKPATEAARKCRFQPARRGGLPEWTYVELEFSFDPASRETGGRR